MSIPREPTALGELRVQHFEPLVGERFALDLDGRVLDLQLEEATSIGRARPGLDRTPFSLVFSAPALPALPQSSYPIDHASLGQLELFLVPISSDGQRLRYEAVFA